MMNTLVIILMALPFYESATDALLLHDRFLAHVDGLGTLSAEQLASLHMEARDTQLIVRGLSLLEPAFADALAHFDYGRYDAAASGFAQLQAADDPFLSAESGYWLARTEVARDRLEEAERLLLDWSAPATGHSQHSVRGAQVLLLLAHCQLNNLRFDETAATLETVATEYPQTSEALAIAAQQMKLELSRRERGTLGEVADYMDYSASRLAAEDDSQSVRRQQDHIVELLDNLIEQAEQNEQRQGGGGGSRQNRGQRQSPSNPLEESRVTPGAGKVGELHTAPKADPGEMWGKLPPSERERILQSLRNRFPSRYRQLVEQYYRSMAEEK